MYIYNSPYTIHHHSLSILLLFSCYTDLTLCVPMDSALQAPLSFTISQALVKFMPIDSMMLSKHLILCYPLLLFPSMFCSIRWLFSNESALLNQWPKYGNFNFSISPSNERSGLIIFRIDWLNLLAVQGTLKSLLQHHNSKALILRCSALFMVQLSHIGKIIVFTIWTSVSKVMALLFINNTLSGFVIIFLPKSKRLLNSWLQSPSTVILEPRKIKAVTVSLSPLLLDMKLWDQMPWSWFL